MTEAMTRLSLTRTVIFTAIVLQVFVFYYFYTCSEHVSSNDSNAQWKRVKRIPRQATEVNWESVKRNQAPPKDEMYDKWIIITTINEPTEDVKKLASIEGWKVVVVGDTKTPSGWSLPNCVFLSVEKQKTLGYRIVDLLPYKSYARKNLGYLYAIHHGAKYIYETDDDNSPTSGQITFYEQTTGEFYVYATNRLTVNPYAHFGQVTIWPRGYPLENISLPNENTFHKCNNVEPTIQQGVVDGDPDVDAIFRLTRKDADVRIDVKFDSSAPAVLLPPHTMAPFNSQNTFFMHKGFWGLLIPVTPTFRVCDIWRGYWAQRLLWEVNGYLSFFPPNAKQYRSAHNFLLDFIEEKELYHKSGKLVKFLTDWKSEKDHFFSRILDLSIAMAEAEFWGTEDALLTEAWLHDLISVGYEPPRLKPTVQRCSEEEPVKLEPKHQASSYLGIGSKLVDIL
ncbi:probable glycosyltransferase STELLO1 [Nematostella vectensis]|uniref:probable glycosyltransferase STELLO1 n=1 Tax=Nematostella vectensis TaxID=45351 RepID=UPI002077528D|nr:probable glycosyltransferase STELLO1 [Nematostella vectensis]